MSDSTFPIVRPFALFAGSDHYPSGGMADMVGTFDTLEEALEFYHEPDEDGDSFEWGQVVSVATFTIIALPHQD